MQSSFTYLIHKLVLVLVLVLVCLHSLTKGGFSLPCRASSLCTGTGARRSAQSWRILCLRRRMRILCRRIWCCGDWGGREGGGVKLFACSISVTEHIKSNKEKSHHFKSTNVTARHQRLKYTDLC